MKRMRTDHLKRLLLEALEALEGDLNVTTFRATPHPASYQLIHPYDAMAGQKDTDFEMCEFEAVARRSAELRRLLLEALEYVT